MKIDTQGAEHEVFRGMDRLMNRQFVAGITEFTPSGLRTRVDPEEFLSRLLRKHFVYQVSISDAVCEQIVSHGVKDFVSSVENSSRYWTDLICFPQKLPAVQELIDAFEQ